MENTLTPNDFIQSLGKSGLKVYQHMQRRRSKNLVPDSIFFASPILVKVDEYCIYFTKPSIDYIGKVITPHLSKGWYYFTITDEEILECGNFNFDLEESTEDCLIVNHS